MSATIQGGKATLKNLSSKQGKLDEEVLKQQEILYTQVGICVGGFWLGMMASFLLSFSLQDFQLQQLQHKLNRLEGERTDDEKAVLFAKIKV